MLKLNRFKTEMPTNSQCIEIAESMKHKIYIEVPRSTTDHDKPITGEQLIAPMNKLNFHCK